jgi:hypothetical protein
MDLRVARGILEVTEHARRAPVRRDEDEECPPYSDEYLLTS